MHADHVAAPDALPDQPLCQPPGRADQLGVAQRLTGAGGRRCGRGAGGLPQDQLRHRPVQVVVAVRTGGPSEQLVPLAGVEQVQRSDAGIGAGGKRALEEGDEPIPVGAQGFGLMQRGIALEGDRQLGAVGATEDLDRQVGHRSGGELVGAAGALAEGQLEVEGDQVDHHAGQVGRAVGRAELALQLLAAVALVAQQLTDAGAHLSDQLVEPAGGLDPQPQRQDVGQHAGRAQCLPAGTGADREAEHHVALLGDPPDVGGGGGQYQDRPVGAVRGGRRSGITQFCPRLEPGRRRLVRRTLLIGPLAGR